MDQPAQRIEVTVNGPYLVYGRVPVTRRRPVISAEPGTTDLADDRPLADGRSDCLVSLRGLVEQALLRQLAPHQRL